MSQFDITGLTAQLGVAHQVAVVTSVMNSMGDATYTRVNYSIIGIIQVMGGAEEEVQEGFLDAEDIIIFYDDQQTNLSKVCLGNQLYYGGRYYRIKNVIANDGHVEVYAKKM